MEQIIAAFLLGLYGSGHCISMCGPVVGVLGLNTQINRASAAFLYNLGRISTYALLGIIAAILSIALNDLQPIQGIMRYIAGILMLFVALQFFGFPKFLGFIEKPLRHLTKPITNLSRRFFPINTKLRAYMAGLIWGLFPCGMVYAAFAISLSATSFIQAPLIMLSFGLGTFAVVFSISLFGNYASQWLARPKLRIVAGILILIMTLFYMGPILLSDLGLVADPHAGMDHGSSMPHDHSISHDHPAAHEHSINHIDDNINNNDTINHNQHNIENPHH